MAQSPAGAEPSAPLHRPVLTVSLFLTPKQQRPPQPHSQHTAANMCRVPKYGSCCMSPCSCKCLSQVSSRPPAPPGGLSLLLSTPQGPPRAAAGGVVPHARLFVLLHCRCCHADKDRLHRGPVAGCHGWQQDVRCLNWPGGFEMAWGSGGGGGGQAHQGCAACLQGLVGWESHCPDSRSLQWGNTTGHKDTPSSAASPAQSLGSWGIPGDSATRA